MNLRGLRLALAFYDVRIGDSIKILFRGMETQGQLELTLNIRSAVSTRMVGGESVETPLNEGVAQAGWTFMTYPIDADLIVSYPGDYRVFLSEPGGEQYLGTATFAQVPVPPFSTEEITAIKSDPLASKFVRFILSCTKCDDEFKAYAGVERSELSEAQGFQWNLDIKQDEFLCSCGKTRINLASVKTGLHGYLLRNVHPQTQNISAVRLYESTTLEQYCREFLAVIGTNSKEEDVQKFLEAHPLFFHLFQPKRISIKPPILTKYVADFGILNSRDELLLVEIERPQMKLLRRDGGKTADLEHAFHQVRTWKQVFDEHRTAALDALGINLSEVARVKGVVVAGRKPPEEQRVKMLRSLSTAETELFTYDDLLSSVSELVKHIASI
jgi:hypothetical protein